MVQCPVCLDEITVTTGDTEDILKMPCCRNFAHKTCLQQTAYASGYFFKCPYCSDKFKFEKEMIRFGIFIPQRDAAWEEEEGAYAELLETYTRCDNPVCKCPQGREHSQQEGLWRCIRCHHCGQSAVHNHCLGRHRVPTYEYVCINCTPTNQQQQTSSSSKSSISNKSSPAKSSISKKNSPAKSSNSMKTSPTKPHQRSSPSKILKPCQSSSSNRQSSCVPTSITALQRHENTKKEKALHINYLQPKKPVNWRKYDIRECRVVVKSLTEEFIRKHLHSTGVCPSSPLSTSPKKIISINNQERWPTTRTSYIMDQKPCVTKYEMSPINQECSADDFTHVADDSKDSIVHAPSPKTHDLSSPICIDVDGLTDKISFKFNPSPISSPSSSRSSQLADVFSKAKCSTPGVTVTQHVNSTPTTVSILTTINLTPTPQHGAHAKGTRKRLNPHTRKQTKLTKFFKKETDS